MTWKWTFLVARLGSLTKRWDKWRGRPAEISERLWKWCTAAAASDMEAKFSLQLLCNKREWASLAGAREEYQCKLTESWKKPPSVSTLRCSEVTGRLLACLERTVKCVLLLCNKESFFFPQRNQPWPQKPSSRAMRAAASAAFSSTWNGRGSTRPFCAACETSCLESSRGKKETLCRRGGGGRGFTGCCALDRSTWTWLCAHKPKQKPSQSVMGQNQRGYFFFFFCSGKHACQC